VFSAGEAVGRRQGQEDEETSNNILKSSAATVEPEISKDAVPGPPRKGRAGGQLRPDADAGESKFGGEKVRGRPKRACGAGLGQCRR
jgi:hypothetical protein